MLSKLDTRATLSTWRTPIRLAKICKSSWNKSYIKAFFILGTQVLSLLCHVLHQHTFCFLHVLWDRYTYLPHWNFEFSIQVSFTFSHNCIAFVLYYFTSSAKLSSKSLYSLFCKRIKYIPTCCVFIILWSRLEQLLNAGLESKFLFFAF